MEKSTIKDYDIKYDDKQYIQEKFLSLYNVIGQSLTILSLSIYSYKAVDFWLTYVHTHRALIARHYTPTAFLSLSTSTTRRLFLDLVTSLQPLAQMPLRLEYNFERRLLQQRHQVLLQAISDYESLNNLSRFRKVYDISYFWREAVILLQFNFEILWVSRMTIFLFYSRFILLCSASALYLSLH